MRRASLFIPQSSPASLAMTASAAGAAGKITAAWQGLPWSPMLGPIASLKEDIL